MFIILTVLIGVGVYLIFISFRREEQVSILNRVNVNPIRRGFVNIINIPSYLLYPLNMPLLKIAGIKKILQRKLSFIGSQLLPQDFMFVKEVFAVLAGLGFWAVTKSNDIRTIAAFSILGFFLPEIWLISRVKKFKFEIIKYFPETVDLLGLCVESGLDFVTSLRWVLDKSKPNILLDHLRIVLNEITMGKSKQDALRNMARRVDVSEIRSFVNTLVRAERTGSPIQETFDIISDDTRDKRVQIAEKQALRAPILIVFPLVLILAVVIIIVGGPIIIRFQQGGFMKL